MDGYSNKHKHLEFIQLAISRMASNLFYIKGWTITLIAGLFALSEQGADRTYLLIAFFPAFTFWFLDGYFLAQERSFRALYDDVRQRPESAIDFSMDLRKYRSQFRNTWLGGMFSTTVGFYYGALIVVLIVLMHFLSQQPQG